MRCFGWGLSTHAYLYSHGSLCLLCRGLIMKCGLVEYLSFRVKSQSWGVYYVVWSRVRFVVFGGGGVDLLLWKKRCVPAHIFDGFGLVWVCNGFFQLRVGVTIPLQDHVKVSMLNLVWLANQRWNHHYLKYDINQKCLFYVVYSINKELSNYSI